MPPPPSRGGASAKPVIKVCETARRTWSPCCEGAKEHNVHGAQHAQATVKRTGRARIKASCKRQELLRQEHASTNPNRPTSRPRHQTRPGFGDVASKSDSCSSRTTAGPSEWLAGPANQLLSYAFRFGAKRCTQGSLGTLSTPTDAHRLVPRNHACRHCRRTQP
jgi:hypothetical protein